MPELWPWVQESCDLAAPLFSWCISGFLFLYVCLGEGHISCSESLQQKFRVLRLCKIPKVRTRRILWWIGFPLFPLLLLLIKTKQTQTKDILSFKQEIKEASETWCLSMLQFSLNAHRHLYFLAFSFTVLLSLVLLVQICFKNSSAIKFNIFKFTVRLFFHFDNFSSLPRNIFVHSLGHSFALWIRKILLACSCIFWSTVESNSTKLNCWFLDFFIIYLYILLLIFLFHYFYCWPSLPNWGLVGQTVWPVSLFIESPWASSEIHLNSFDCFNLLCTSNPVSHLLFLLCLQFGGTEEIY